MTNLRESGLRLLVLDLLNDRPREHTQLRAALRDRLGGRTEVASALLSRILHTLETEGAVGRDAGATNLYFTSAKGSKEVADRAAELDALAAAHAGNDAATTAFDLRRGLTEFRDALRCELGQLPPKSGRAAASQQSAGDAAAPQPAAAPHAAASASEEPWRTRSWGGQPGQLARRIDELTQVFRLQLRASAREADARGALTPELTADVERELTALQQRLTERMRGA